MLIKDVVNLVNQKLAGELLSYNEMRIYLDTVIDDINSQLNTVYPTFSELGSAVEYTAFPDKYIAVWLFQAQLGTFTLLMRKVPLLHSSSVVTLVETCSLCKETCCITFLKNIRQIVCKAPLYHR